MPSTRPQLIMPTLCTRATGSDPMKKLPLPRAMYSVQISGRL